MHRRLSSLDKFRARIPLFWQVQIAAWVALAIVSFPLKVGFYGSVPLALLITMLREPFGLLITSSFRFIYNRLNLRPGKLIHLLCWAVPICFAAGALDVILSEAILVYGWGVASDHLDGLFYFRSLLFLSWTFLFFWIREFFVARERAAELTKATAAAQEAELLMLRAQVSAHFLFNAFNTILASLETRPQTAEDVVMGLSDYFRYSLNNRRSALVTIGEEFDAMAGYLLVEQARFRESIIVDTSIDPDVRSVQVPGVFLQPLLENALHYSLMTSPLPRRVEIHVQKSASGCLVITVTNSGRWIDSPIPGSLKHSGGNGLTTLRQRLELLYPGTHTLAAGPNAQGDEVTVRVEVPAGPVAEIVT